MHGGNFLGMGYGGFGFGWIFMALFWIMIIIAIGYLVRLVISDTREARVAESAEDILKKQYAYGNITKEEFQKKIVLITNRS